MSKFVFSAVLVSAISSPLWAQPPVAESDVPESVEADEAVDDAETELEDQNDAEGGNDVDRHDAAVAAQLDSEARTRFQLGHNLYEQGRFEEALVEFERAHELSQRPGLLYNIYLAHRDAGHTADALTWLRRYLAEEDTIPTRAMLERRLAVLEAEVERDADVERRARDAEERASAQPSLAHNYPGPHITLGAGVLVLGIAGVLGLTARGMRDDLLDDCYDGARPVCLREQEDDIDGLDTRNLTADILAGVGGAAMLGGLIWLIVEATTGGTPTTVSCGPRGCSIGGTF